MKKRRNKIKKCGRTYVFERDNTDDIIKLLKMFDAREIFVEIGDICADSTFCQNAIYKKGKYVVSGSSDRDYMDIVIAANINEDFPDILNEIMDGEPDIVSFNLTDLSWENFTYYIQKIYAYRTIEIGISYFVVEVIPDENVLGVVFNAELFSPHDLIPRVEAILFKKNT